MKKPLVLIHLFFTLCIGLYAQKADSWQTFTPPNHKFSVSVPCLPVAPPQTDPAATPTEYDCVHDKTLFYLQLNKVKWQGATPTRVEIETFCKAFLEGAKGQLTSQIEITSSGVVGRELVFKMAPPGGQEMQARMRALFLGDTVYVVSAITSATASLPPAADKFLNSVVFAK